MTIKAGVIGWPVAHSLSPVLHGYWLRHYGIDGVYEKIAAAPEDFVSTIARLRGEGFCGVNVTVPHKEAAFALAEDNDTIARSAGATNLLVFRPGEIRGHNTDVHGLVAAVEEKAGLLAGKNAILLGAGGAARGALIALRQLGAGSIRLLARDTRRAVNMASAVVPPPGPAATVEVMPLSAFAAAAADAALVVNATSAGMGSNPPLDLDLSALPQAAAVCDMVYHPLETPLLKDARARGLLAIDGLGMLMHQAVPSFEAFFGTRPAVTLGLRAALVDALAHR
jgi:shikimate dehydrogenase